MVLANPTYRLLRRTTYRLTKLRDIKLYTFHMPNSQEIILSRRSIRLTCYTSITKLYAGEHWQGGTAATCNLYKSMVFGIFP